MPNFLFSCVENFGVRADGQFLSHRIIGRVPFDRIGRLEKALKRRRKERRANVFCSVVTKRLQVRPPTSNSDANDLYAGSCFPFSFHLSLSPSFALVSSLPAYTRDQRTRHASSVFAKPVHVPWSSAWSPRTAISIFARVPASELIVFGRSIRACVARSLLHGDTCIAIRVRDTRPAIKRGNILIHLIS